MGKLVRPNQWKTWAWAASPEIREALDSQKGESEKVWEVVGKTCTVVEDQLENDNFEMLDRFMEFQQANRRFWGGVYKVRGRVRNANNVGGVLTGIRLRSIFGRQL